MRIANLSGRAVLVGTDATVTDIARASEGRFGPELGALYTDWEAFASWASLRSWDKGQPYERSELGPVSRPAQVFAVAMNYREHAREIGIPLPTEPAVFTKFTSCLSGPFDTVSVPSDYCDYEVEIVAVIGTVASHVAEEDAWSHVAGLTIGQDISERVMQTAGSMPQFSLAKSFPGFGPVGPELVTLDEFDDLEKIGLQCLLNDEEVQSTSTEDLIFPIPNLVSRLSRIVTLMPGDLIFTGTPAGVGVARRPQRFLRDGDVLTSRIEGIGEMTQKIAATR